MKKKAAFFDIDGTLWDQKMQIPKSTIEGIQRFREKGNYAFLSSGRSRAAVRTKELLDIGFDGILCGCGTHIEYQGKLLFEKKLSLEQLTWLKDFFEKKKMPALFEGRDSIYADIASFGGDFYIGYLQELLGEDMRDISQMDETSVVNKISALCRQVTKEELAEALSADWHLVNHASVVVEVMPKGYSKATGIEWICKYLGIDHEDTYAFGDSANDLDMLEYVAHGVAMGNGSEEAKKTASYVTTDIHEDGIWNALKHFELI